jgi:hypothetical protein
VRGKEGKGKKNLFLEDNVLLLQLVVVVEQRLLALPQLFELVP